MYGFAGGDPVNFSDPFGLCPEWLKKTPCGLKFWGVQTTVVLLGGAEFSVTTGRYETATETGSFTTVGAPVAGGAGKSAAMQGNVQYVEGGSESLDTFRGPSTETTVAGSVAAVIGSGSVVQAPNGKPVGYSIGVGVSTPGAAVTVALTHTTIGARRSKDGSVVKQ